MFKTLDGFCHWLEATSLSQAIQGTDWLIPLLQTIHILAIATLMASILMINLRLAGLVGRGQPAVTVAKRFLPPIWWTVIILLCSGIPLIIAEPARALENPIFGLKMALLATVLILTLIYQQPLKAKPDFWERSRARAAAVKTIAFLSSILWVGVVFAGRWIAYTQAN